MKLWILEPVEDSDKWMPWYDKAFGFIVRAECEEDARAIAANDHRDEGKEAWLSNESSTCQQLTDEGEPEMVMSDVHWA